MTTLLIQTQSVPLTIDRKNRKVYIYRPEKEPEILDNPETVSADPELPGFVLRMAKIW